MSDTNSAYTLKLDRLRGAIRKRTAFPEAMELALDVHAMTHDSAVSGSSVPTYYDSIFLGLDDGDFSEMPTPGSDAFVREQLTYAGLSTERFFSLAWHLWHITRIEDIVGNILIKNAPQVFNARWSERLGTRVTDTGNAMSDAEVAEFSRQLNIDELKKYRIAVGLQTREIIKILEFEDMKRKPVRESLERIMMEGGLSGHKASAWLLDFWGQKTEAGCILLPLTRHHKMHLDVCVHLKEAIKEQGGSDC